jgi:hypothetical protein
MIKFLRKLAVNFSKKTPFLGENILKGANIVIFDNKFAEIIVEK